MSLKIDTNELPSMERPPFFYGVTPAAFSLGETGPNSSMPGEPIIKIELLTDDGQKRFDNLVLRHSWFEPDFSANQLTQKERGLFFVSIGARNRVGKLKRYLGIDADSEFNSAQEVLGALQETVGKRFLCLETQQTEKQDDPNNPGQTVEVPTNNYNLRLYDPERPPKSLPENVVDLTNRN